MSAPVIRPPRSASERAAAASAQAERTVANPVSPVSGFSGVRRVPPPVNEPVRAYAPGSPEKRELKARLAQMAGERIEIPLIIGGREVRSGDRAQSVMPHDHRHVLADWHRASREHVAQAIDAARAAHREWSNWPWEDRAAPLGDDGQLAGGGAAAGECGGVGARAVWRGARRVGDGGGHGSDLG